jgi:hypothetical protein
VLGLGVFAERYMALGLTPELNQVRQRRRVCLSTLGPDAYHTRPVFKGGKGQLPWDCVYLWNDQPKARRMR